MRFLLLTLLLAAASPVVRAQAPGDELSVYIMTMGPGDEIFEKFGHNTIRIVDHSTGEDIVYNWGVFDFRQSSFYINFLQGKLNYWVDSAPYQDTVRWYQGLDRSIWMQELNFTPAQKVTLRDLCRWYDRDENRYYLYNYYTDNCSTRVRDVLDQALGGQIKPQLNDKPTGVTFRWHTRRLTRDSVPWYTALNTVLGPAVDRPISQWEEGFLPVRLMGHLRNVTVAGGPLVKSEQTIYQSTRLTEPDAPPNWVVQYGVVGVAIGAILAGLSLAATRGRGGRIAFAIAAVPYALVLGLAGGLGLWAWFFTAHWAAWRNENLFGYSPIALPLAFLIPFMFARPKVRRMALGLALGVAGSTLIGLVLSPMLPQVIAEPMALMLPINLALAWAVWHVVKTAKPRAAG